MSIIMIIIGIIITIIITIIIIITVIILEINHLFAPFASLCMHNLTLTLTQMHFLEFW